MFFPHFDLLYNLLVNRHTATWNLFVLYLFNNKETNYYSFFISNYFVITQKQAFAHFAMHSKELVQKNHATVKLITITYLNIKSCASIWLYQDLIYIAINSFFVIYNFAVL